MHEMHGDHSLVEFKARSKSSNSIGNSYDMDRDSRDTDHSTDRSGYSRDTIECLFASAMQSVMTTFWSGILYEPTQCPQQIVQTWAMIYVYIYIY